MITLTRKLVAMLPVFAFAFVLSACSDQSQTEGAAEQATDQAMEEPATEGDSTTTE